MHGCEQVQVTRNRSPEGTAASFSPRLDARAANLSIDMSRWKEKGVLWRYAHWAERGELLRGCRDLRSDIADLRVRLHELPPPHAPDHNDDLQATTSEDSAHTVASSPTSSIAASSLTAVSSIAPKSSPKMPPPSLPDDSAPAKPSDAAADRDDNLTQQRPTEEGLKPTLHSRLEAAGRSGRARTSALAALPRDTSLSARHARAAKSNPTRNASAARPLILTAEEKRVALMLLLDQKQIVDARVWSRPRSARTDATAPGVAGSPGPDVDPKPIGMDEGAGAKGL